jgi:alpha-ketoglutarate-dependent taurine dioxygenase
MNVTVRTRLDVVPLSKHIGAEIRGIDLRAAPDLTLSRIFIRHGSTMPFYCFAIRAFRRRICYA